MKPINIKHFCRLPLAFDLLLFMCLPIVVLLLYTGIAEKNGNLITIMLLILSVVWVGLSFYFNYGIKITSKRVYVIYQDAFKIFRYDDIIYFEIFLDNDAVYGRIKAKNQKVFDFYFGDFILGFNRISFFNRLWTVRIKLSDKYIHKKQKELLTCEKVRIRK